MTIKSYRDLTVWQSSVDLAIKIYECTKTFPKSEAYGLTNQLRRAATSVPSNISEGRNRGTRKDFAHFLRVALGSVAEVQTQLIIAYRLQYISKEQYLPLENHTIEITKMLYSLVRKLLTPQT